MKSRTPSGWRRKLLFAGVTILVMLGTFEVVLRFFGYGDFILYRPDPELLWVPRENQRGKTVVGHRPITINAEGFRYPSALGKRGVGEFRILTFGDSVTQGWGVDDDSHYTAVLERRLRDRNTRGVIRAISAGVNAYPTSLCVRRFIYLLDHGYQIDVAVLAYSFNQGFDPISRLDDEEKKRFLRKVWLKSLVRRSGVYNLVIEDWLRTTVYYRLRDQLIEGSWQTEAEAQAGDLGPYLANLERMRAKAAQEGVKLAFLLLGSKDQRERLHPEQEAFLQFAAEQGIPIVNMVARLAPLSHDGMFIDHTHPGPEIHAMIAEELSSLIAARWLNGGALAGEGAPSGGRP
jgi:lysophospholipase L1-like esterase